MLWTRGLTVPAASSGQTCASRSRRDRALFLDAARPKRRSGERRAALHQRCQVDLGLVASLEPDLHEAAVLREALDVAAQVVAADDVEDDVDALTVGQLLGRPATKSVVR